jgi:hypothetical protein
VVENRVLRNIFGPERDEVMGRWREPHNEELCDLYTSPSIIRIIKSKRMMWAGHVAQIREKRIMYRLFIGNPDGKRPLGRSKRKWVDNVKMDVVEIGWCGWTGWVCLRIGTGGELL